VTTAPTLAAEPAGLPRAKSPLWLVGIVVGLLVVVGLVVATARRARR
jgi:hypothetical protein